MNAVERLRRGRSYRTVGQPNTRTLVFDDQAEWDAAVAAFERLLAAADDLTRKPFGQLNERDFYRTREAVRECREATDA